MTGTFFRESLVGYVIWWACKPQWLAYPEEKEGVFNSSHSAANETLKSALPDSIEPSATATPLGDQSPAVANSLRHAPFAESGTEKDFQVGNKPREDGIILVDWYLADDAENPQNWTAEKKCFVLLCIALYSFVVYIGAPIYTPSLEYFMAEYGVSTAYASLGLSAYILGYGSGPLLFSPLSEIPWVGRALPYPTTFFVFVIISIGTATSKSAASFMALRYLQGFFGSPSMATGGASIADVYSPVVLPHAMTSWVLACYCAPALGPLVAGFAVPVLGWRFSIWEICIVTGPVLILLCLLPETSSATILRSRARRLRRITGNERYKSYSEIAMHGFTGHQVLSESLFIPMKITFLDPAMLFANLYTTLIYGIYYSFFEAFPLVYSGIYGFNLGEMGMAFLAIVVGAIFAFVIYNTYIYMVHVPLTRAGKTQEPEDLLIPALYASFLPPIGLLLFGWAASPHVHWIVPTIGIVIFPGAVFIIMQCIFIYVPAVYPKYAASIFAAQDITRCVFAAGAVIIARPLYINLGIGGGCSLLAGLMALCILGMQLLYRKGGNLRRRSKFVSKW